MMYDVCTSLACACVCVRASGPALVCVRIRSVSQGFRFVFSFVSLFLQLSSLGRRKSQSHRLFPAGLENWRKCMCLAFPDPATRLSLSVVWVSVFTVFARSSLLSYIYVYAYMYICVYMYVYSTFRNFRFPDFQATRNLVS